MVAITVTINIVLNAVHLLVLFDRRKANKCPSCGRGSDAKTDKREVPIYELASEVAGDVNTADHSGQFVSTKQANSAGPGDNDPAHTYANATPFDPYSKVNPVQDGSTSRLQTNKLAAKKGAARTAQHGADKSSSSSGAGGDGRVGKGTGGVADEGGVVCDSANDVTLVDNALYVNATALPASSTPLASPPPPSSAAAEAGQTGEPVFTSINDFTLIDNAIYNK